MQESGWYKLMFLLHKSLPGRPFSVLRRSLIDMWRYVEGARDTPRRWERWIFISPTTSKGLRGEKRQGNELELMLGLPE